MKALGHVLFLRLQQDTAIASTDEARRILARTVLEQARDCKLLTFRADGPCLRVLACCDRVAAGQLARVVEITLGQRLRLQVRFQPARIEAVREQWHLHNAFHRILRTAEGDDRFHEASNLPDLLGLRVIGQFTADNVRCLLPRTKRASLLEHLGVAELEPGELSLAGLVPATTAAAGLVTLGGQSRRAVAARAAAVAVVGDVLTTPRLAALLGVSPETVVRLRRYPAQVELVRAIRLQMQLRNILGDRRTPLPTRGIRG